MYVTCLFSYTQLRADTSVDRIDASCECRVKIGQDFLSSTLLSGNVRYTVKHIESVTQHRGHTWANRHRNRARERSHDTMWAIESSSRFALFDSAFQKSLSLVLRRVDVISRFPSTRPRRLVRCCTIATEKLAEAIRIDIVYPARAKRKKKRRLNYKIARSTRASRTAHPKYPQCASDENRSAPSRGSVTPRNLCQDTKLPKYASTRE